MRDDGGTELMRGTVVVVLLLLGLTAVPWGTAAAGIGGVTDAITTATDTPDDTPTEPDGTPTPTDDTATVPDDTPTPAGDTPTPSDDTPTPPEGSPTPPEGSPTPPGGGEGSATVSNLRCVAACENVDLSRIKTQAQFLAMDGIRNVNIRLIAGFGLDLARAGVTSETKFRADVTIEADAGFDPQTLVVIGSQPELVSSSSGTTATATVEFGVTSGAISTDVRVQDPDEWPDRDVTATRQADAIAIVNIADVSDSSREDISEFDGVTIATNAQVFTPPRYEPGGDGTPPKIVIDVAAPHFLPDGTTQNTGEFTARLPNSLLDSWGVTNPEQLTATVSTGGGTLEIVETGDGIVVKLRNYHYSSGTITVQKAESAGTATETPTATATQTATATETATETLTATETPTATASETATATEATETTSTATAATTTAKTAATTTAATTATTAATATSQTTATESGAGQSADQTAASGPGFGAAPALLAVVALLAGGARRRRSR